jgi:hypothetical protein
MSARKEFRFRKETKAAVHIQVWSFQLVLIQISEFYTTVSFFSVPYFVLFNDNLTDMIFWTQARWRCHRDYSHYKNLQGATLTYQCAWRQRLARKELRKLKMVYLYLLPSAVLHFSILWYKHQLCIPWTICRPREKQGPLKRPRINLRSVLKN